VPAVSGPAPSIHDLEDIHDAEGPWCRNTLRILDLLRIVTVMIRH